MKRDIPTITTSRLVLRPFTEEDVEPLYRVLGQKDILCYFPNPNPLSMERVERLIERQLQHWDEHGYGWWAIEARSKPELIGWGGLQYLPETDETEVAYLLSQAFHGNGLGTELAQASLKFGFDRFADLENIIAIVHPENIASQRVALKAGLAFVERTNYFGMDCYRYIIERSDFNG